MRTFPSHLAPNLVVVTRHPSQSKGLGERLRERGFEPLYYPVLDIAKPDDGGEALRAACAAAWDWLVLTSGNALRAVAYHIGKPLAGQRVAVVGKMTATLVTGLGWAVDHVASQGDARSLLKDLHGMLQPGQRVFLPQAANARPLLADGLAALEGVQLLNPVAYITTAQRPDMMLPVERIRAITLASSATVERFCWAIGPPVRHRLLQCQVQWVAIGRQTYQCCLDHGLGPLTKASEPTTVSLANAVL